LILFSKTKVFWNLLTLGQFTILFIYAIEIICKPFKRQWNLTRSKVESEPPEELVAGQSVVVPHGEFEGTIVQLLQTDVLVDKRVVPGRIARAPRHARLLLAPSTLLRQQVAANYTHEINQELKRDN